MRKINGKLNLLFYCSIVLLFVLLVYSRFVGLSWGLPYPMHPDERNMANAVQQLKSADMFNPHFFAYGQFPLYLGYIIVYILKFFDGDMGLPIGFEEATLSLRIISAIASIINFIFIIKIIRAITKNKSFLLTLISGLIIIFSPYAIQFAHFGTTESLLMLFYSLIIYLSLQLQESRTSGRVIWLALVSGLAVATKVSSIIFIAVPLIAILSSLRSWDRYIGLIKFGVLTTIFIVLFSPHNFINFQDFISSINYESEVALGKSLVFYTRQFFNTQPILFQLEKVFPYTLGLPIYIMGLIGFMSLDWTNRKINLLRFAFLIYFIPSAMIYAKWSRFMSPIFPIMTIFAILFLSKIKVINIIKIIIVIIAIIPGIAYLSVYQNPDVRFIASDWIYKNIPNNSNILFETANVVDIPVESESYKVHKVYNVISFNFYDLDISPELQLDLKNEIEKADYIFIPSRRIFINNTCYVNDKLQITNDKSITNNKCQILKKTYPLLSKYYEDLFSGKLGFKKVAEFESYPKIFQWKFPDEQAEETWTVFDHPVIRIYKKNK